MLAAKPPSKSENTVLPFGSSLNTNEQQAINNQKPSRPDGMAQFLTVEQRQDPAWEAQALDFLNEVEKWKGEHDETESNYFDQVCFIYIPLVELMPPGAVRDKGTRQLCPFSC